MGRGLLKNEKERGGGGVNLIRSIRDMAFPSLQAFTSLHIEFSQPRGLSDYLVPLVSDFRTGFRNFCQKRRPAFQRERVFSFSSFLPWTFPPSTFYFLLGARNPPLRCPYSRLFV